jgi:streptomycin 6-kinase
MISELLKIISELLPMLHKDDAEKIQAKLDKLEKEREEKYARLLKALNDGDVGAVNLLLSELLGEL